MKGWSFLQEALSIRGVGGRLADKVAEIVESGKLRKVAEVCEDEEAQTLQRFMGVWGAGPTTAHGWYIQVCTKRNVFDFVWVCVHNRKYDLLNIITYIIVVILNNPLHDCVHGWLCNQAHLCIFQGYRTLEDLREKGNLTRHQQIGLKYYDDINSRIPREEVAEIENYVRVHAKL